MTEYAEERDKARAKLLRSLSFEKDYDGYDPYGRSNDDLPPSQAEAPLPYIPPTEQSESGFEGLDPPLG